MRVELWKLNDEHPFNTHDIGAWAPEDLTRLARDILVSYYDGDNRSIWPKPSSRSKAPEEVRIVHDSGEVLAHCEVRHVIEDTRRELVGSKPG